TSNQTWNLRFTNPGPDQLGLATATLLMACEGIPAAAPARQHGFQCWSGCIKMESDHVEFTRRRVEPHTQGTAPAGEDRFGQRFALADRILAGDHQPEPGTTTLPGAIP